ncbi:MAG: hypothetical protein Q9214_005991 [Letrouitia sp. 1 TL-2023]
MKDSACLMVLWISLFAFFAPASALDNGISTHYNYHIPQTNILMEITLGSDVPSMDYLRFWEFMHNAQLSLLYQARIHGGLSSPMSSRFAFRQSGVGVLVQGNILQHTIREWPTFEDADKTLYGMRQTIPEHHYKDIRFKLWRLDTHGQRTFNFGSGFFSQIQVGDWIKELSAAAIDKSAVDDLNFDSNV